MRDARTLDDVVDDVGARNLQWVRIIKSVLSLLTLEQLLVSASVLSAGSWCGLEWEWQQYVYLTLTAFARGSRVRGPAVARRDAARAALVCER